MRNLRGGGQPCSGLAFIGLEMRKEGYQSIGPLAMARPEGREQLFCSFVVGYQPERTHQGEGRMAVFISNSNRGQVRDCRECLIGFEVS